LSSEWFIIIVLIGSNIGTAIVAWTWKREADYFERLVHIWQRLEKLVREQRDEAWEQR
jgi:hypothetical protein